MNARTKVDIANEREAKKRELAELIEGIDKIETPPETQAKIDALEADILALENELLENSAGETKTEEDPDKKKEEGQEGRSKRSNIYNLVEKRNIKVTGGASGSERRFSLLNAVRCVVENRAFDPFTQTVFNSGKDELHRSGIGENGQIVIPSSRAAVQAQLATKGLEAIAEEKLDLIGPLYNELVLKKVGVSFLTGLVSDISIPVYSGTNVGWAGEIAAAADGSGTFKEINLKPKRLTAFIDISKQFILQDSTSAEALLRSDIIEAIRQKLEKTLLGASAGSATQPQGLFYSASALPEVSTYEQVLDVEMGLLNNNATPKFYLASPLAYANLRKMAKPEAIVPDKGSNIAVGSSIVDSNTVSGIPLVISSNVYTDTTEGYGGYLVGSFEDYVVAQWGNIDLTVDPYSQSTNGVVRLVVNAYFDAALKRPTVAAALTLIEPEKNRAGGKSVKTTV